MPVVEGKADHEQTEIIFAEQARRELDARCPYASCFRDVNYDLKSGVVRLQGSVASFYLKQVLQTFLKELEGVQQIDNQVNVVNSQGLSSVHPK